MASEKRGLFMTIEGPDGAGKTTVLQQVAQRLTEVLQVPILITREPGGSPIAERIRDVILDPAHTMMDQRTEALLYAASRRQHLVERVLPALARGELVLCDRFVDSSLAYQGVARGIGVPEILAINEFATAGMQPDMTLYVDVDTQIGLQRVYQARGQRQFDRLDQETEAFHQAVRLGYLHVCRLYPERIVTVDGNEPIEQVVATAYQHVWRFIAAQRPQWLS